MNGFFNGYGSLLFLAGIIGFMVFMHSRGHGCGMGGCGSHAHGGDHHENNQEGSVEEKSDSGEKIASRSGSCH